MTAIFSLCFRVAISGALSLAFLTDAGICQDIRYLQLDFHTDSIATQPSTSYTITYDIASERTLMGFYYITPSQNGIVISSLGDERAEWQYAVVYNLRPQCPEQGRCRVTGDTNLWNFLDCIGQFVEGYRLDTNIVTGEAVEMRPFRLTDGRTVTWSVTALMDCPMTDQDCGVGAIRLVSSLLKDGVVLDKVTTNRRLIDESFNFDIKFRVGSIDTLSYAVQILLPDARASLSEEVATYVELRRSYFSHPTTDSLDGRALHRLDRTITSRRDIVLFPGQELRIVFPPDSGSVLGFSIEDTLVIVPKGATQHREE